MAHRMGCDNFQRKYHNNSNLHLASIWCHIYDMWLAEGSLFMPRSRPMFGSTASTESCAETHLKHGHDIPIQSRSEHGNTCQDHKARGRHVGPEEKHLTWMNRRIDFGQAHMFLMDCSSHPYLSSAMRWLSGPAPLLAGIYGVRVQRGPTYGAMAIKMEGRVVGAPCNCQTLWC